MDDLKAVVAKNITTLRRSNGLTQAGLAEKLNYTDKAVSKWERSESLPDVIVLKAIADCFGVTVDYLLTDEHEEEAASKEEAPDEASRLHSKNRGFITGMCALLVWLVACAAFIAIKAFPKVAGLRWLPLVYALPVSAIVWLVLNSIWFDVRRNFLIISLLMWSSLLAVFLTLLAAGISAPQIFLLGVPGQAIVFLWSRIKRSAKR